MTRAAGYFWNPALEARKTGPFCPESQQRYRVVAPEAVFAQAGVQGPRFGFETRDADILTAVHDEGYVDTVRGAHQAGRRYLDSGETEVTPDVFDQALLSASAGCEAVDRIMAGDLEAAFCALRPPGHHANRHRALGFCIFNNAAVAAAHAQKRHGIERVLIVDWDVHPGNGTQEIFFDDPTVFTVSIHQANLFPEAGREDLTGRGAGLGFNRNVPIPPGTPAAGYLERLEQAVAGAAASIRPNLLVISAGFDAHRADPASSLPLENEDFETMTRLVLGAARPFTGGRVVSLLEGGYSLGALQGAVAAHYRALCAPQSG